MSTHSLTGRSSDSTDMGLSCQSPWSVREPAVVSFREQQLSTYSVKREAKGSWHLKCFRVKLKETRHLLTGTTFRYAAARFVYSVSSKPVGTQISSESAYSATFRASVYISMDFVHSPSLNTSFPSPKRFHTRSLMNTWKLERTRLVSFYLCMFDLEKRRSQAFFSHVALSLSINGFYLVQFKCRCLIVGGCLHRLPHTALGFLEMEELTWKEMRFELQPFKASTGQKLKTLKGNVNYFLFEFNQTHGA